LTTRPKDEEYNINYGFFFSSAIMAAHSG